MPDGEEGRRLLVALLSNGSYLADLLLADAGGAGARCWPIPSCAGASRASGCCAELRPGLRRGRASCAGCSGRCAGYARRRDVAAGGAGDRLGDHAGGGARAVRRWPTPAWSRRCAVCDGRAARGLRRAAARRERPPGFVVLGMGKLGGEELNFSSDVDLVYLYSTDEGAAGVADPARILRAPVADGDPGAGRAAPKTGMRLPGGPAAAARGAQRRHLQLAGGGRALLRDLRPDLGAAGAAAGAAVRRRPRAGRGVPADRGALRVPALAANAAVSASVDRLVWYAGWADKIAQVVGSTNPVAGPYFDFSIPEPTGVVAIVAPQESSLLGLVSVLAPAIVTGNTAVVLTSFGVRCPRSRCQKCWRPLMCRAA